MLEKEVREDGKQGGRRKLESENDGAVLKDENKL